MFNDQQRARLRMTVRKNPDWNKPNPLLNEVIEQIRLESPECFHTDDTLKTRRFIVQPPQNIPYDRLY
jgi:hypothetical protein